MRLIPARRLVPQPAKVKGVVSEIHRVEAPVKGLSLLGKASLGDPQTATILRNWSVREDRVTIRPGTKLVRDAYPSSTRHPIARLMPFKSPPMTLLAASNGAVARASDWLLLGTGFSSDDWHTTMFSDLSQNKYLIMVNGADGVWSYNGGTDAASPPISGSVAASAAPTVITVAAGDIGHFANGDIVTITGATSGMSVVNGNHVISSVGSPTHTFSLAGIDTAGATPTPQTVSIVVAGAVRKEAITPPASAPWCNPDSFNVVLFHLNRLYFADTANLAVYYLPLQSKGGALEQLPMDPVFRQGGRIVALAAWSVDSGNGMDDKLVVFSSNGEAAIYTGIDPEDTGFGLIGVFHFDAPMSKHSVAAYGGELWVLTSTGLAPMTTLMRAETEKLNKAEKGIISYFRSAARWKGNAGWQLILDSSTGRLINNMPLGSQGSYQQMVRFMPDPVWAQWREIPSRCWAWLDDKLFYGTDDGKVYEVSDYFLSDDGKEIAAEMRGAWSNYKTPGIKHFKLVRVYAQSTGLPVRPYIDIAVNYQDRRAQNQPEVMQPAPATPWGSPWGSPWGRARNNVSVWGGVGRIGNVGAPHIVVRVNGASYELSGFEVVFEQGIVV